MVAPSHAQPGSAQGPEPSTRQCMLGMCPHAHTPRICSETGPIAMGHRIRKRDAKRRVKRGAELPAARPRRPYRALHPGCPVQAPPPQATAFTGGSPRATRWMFSAMTAARASIMPSVHPDTCGVISTLGSVWNGRWDGSVGPAPCG